MAKYEIVGNHSIDGVEPGKKVELDDDRARAFMKAGAIAWPEPKKKPAKKDGGS